MLRSLIFFIFREMVLTKRKKNTIFTNERSVLWVCAEHYRIERPTACWVWALQTVYADLLETTVWVVGSQPARFVFTGGPLR